MSTIKAVIADDEAPLRAQLKALLKGTWPELVICGEAENGPNALALIEKMQPDIAFLDIKMPGFSGIDVAARLTAPCRIVFVTAFDAYAIKAFEQAAVDYLLKPLAADRLEKTIRRLQHQLSAAQTPPAEEAVDSLRRLLSDIVHKDAPRYLEWINARQGDVIRVVPVADICYFKAEDKYTVARTPEEEHLIRTSIQALEEQLNPNQFQRVHRSAIVNLIRVKAVHRSLSGRLDIVLDEPPEKLQVSRRYAHRFKQM